MIFIDREDAGRQLATQLAEFASRKDAIVLGIPRGGVVVAFEVAQALHLPLDIFLSRKLGVPGCEELAFGALAAGDGRYLDEEIIRAAGISPEQIEQVTSEVKATLNQRAILYRDGGSPLRVVGQTVILVDDGIATGASIYAAVRALKQMKPAMLIVAVPVAPSSTCVWLMKVVDRIVCLSSPQDFRAVGQFYEGFEQVSDEVVIELLRRANRSGATATPSAAPTPHEREVVIDLHDVQLRGTLSIPQDAQGIVLFVHGSGSDRFSPRNRYVADVLHSIGLATLLFDLLTDEEIAIDERTSELRFDIGLLSDRLMRVTFWVRRNTSTWELPIGYFGASTGSAAALIAAAELPDIVAAVVSRGGRADLAANSLKEVHAPALLIVGSRDEIVLSLNRRALEELRCHNKELKVIAGATHLFEEQGALEQVAKDAAEWFAKYLRPQQIHEDRAPVSRGA